MKHAGKVKQNSRDQETKEFVVLSAVSKGDSMDRAILSIERTRVQKRNNDESACIRKNVKYKKNKYRSRRYALIGGLRFSRVLHSCRQFQTISTSATIVPPWARHRRRDAAVVMTPSMNETFNYFYGGAFVENYVASIRGSRRAFPSRQKGARRGCGWVRGGTRIYVSP